MRERKGKRSQEGRPHLNGHVAKRGTRKSNSSTGTTGLLLSCVLEVAYQTGIRLGRSNRKTSRGLVHHRWLKFRKRQILNAFVLSIPCQHLQT